MSALFSSLSRSRLHIRWALNRHIQAAVRARTELLGRSSQELDYKWPAEHLLVAHKCMDAEQWSTKEHGGAQKDGICLLADPWP